MYSDSFKYSFHFDVTSAIIVTKYLCVYKDGVLLTHKALYERWYTPYNNPSDLPDVGEQLASILWTQSVIDEYKSSYTESDAYQDIVDSYDNQVDSYGYDIISSSTDY